MPHPRQWVGHHGSGVLDLATPRMATHQAAIGTLRAGVCSRRVAWRLPAASLKRLQCHAKSLFSVAPASSAAGRGGGTCGAEPAPSERPHRPLRRARTRRRERCDLA